MRESKRGRKSRPQKIGSIIHGLLSKWRHQSGANQDYLNGIWIKAVGPQLAKHTQVERLSGRHLLVRVESAAWMNELTYLKEKINITTRQAFSNTGVVVESISFKLGNVSRVSEPPPDVFPSGK